MNRGRATLTGFGAVLLWSLLALLTVGSAPVPPLQLNAICFGIGGGIGLIWVAATGGFVFLRAVPLRVYAFGTAGLFGYHLLYFSALRMAPAAEAGLIAYLWPLLIVLLSGLLPGESLRPQHILGGLIGFAGAALIVASGATGPALRGDLGGVFGHFAPVGRCADRECCGVLSGNSAVVCCRAFPMGNNGLARDRPGLDQHHGIGGRACRPCLFPVGYRDEKGRYPVARCRVLCGTSAVHSGARRRRDCRTNGNAGPCGLSDCRGCGAGGQRQAPGRLAGAESPDFFLDVELLFFQPGDFQIVNGRTAMGGFDRV
jgi:uncharacterized membrane protein